MVFQKSSATAFAPALPYAPVSLGHSPWIHSPMVSKTGRSQAPSSCTTTALYHLPIHREPVVAPQHLRRALDGQARQVLPHYFLWKKNQSIVSLVK